MTHHFEVEDAKKYGIECAVILNNIRFWIEKNKANKVHFYKERYWTYNSAKAFSELFPYLSSTQIARHLRKLEELGVIISDNFNAAGYDKTKWYSLENNDCTKMNKDCTKMNNGVFKNEQPIPDIKPDINISLVGSSQTPTKRDPKKDLFKTKLNEVDYDSLDEKQKKYFKIAVGFNKLFKETKIKLGINNFKDQEEATYGGYVEPIRLAIEKDNWTDEDFRTIFAFLRKDEFWSTVVFSTSKLREKMKDMMPKAKSSKLIKKQVLPKDFWKRELTDEQKKLLSPENLKHWERQKSAMQLEGGRLLPIKIVYEGDEQ